MNDAYIFIYIGNNANLFGTECEIFRLPSGRVGFRMKSPPCRRSRLMAGKKQR